LVSIDHFRQGLLEQMGRAALGGRIDVLLNSGEFYRSLGGYPGSTHGMHSCCDAMEAEMKLGDPSCACRGSRQARLWAIRLTLLIASTAASGIRRGLIRLFGSSAICGVYQLRQPRLRFFFWTIPLIAQSRRLTKSATL
jgi:hypothetical protein